MSTKRSSSTKKRPRSPEKVVQKSAKQVPKDTEEEQATKRAKVTQSASSTKAVNDKESQNKATTTNLNEKSTAKTVEPAKVIEQPATVKPNLTGKFDLYDTGLPFLNKVYKPKGDSAVHPEELYRTILTYQAKNDRTASVYLPDGSSEGEFKSGGICDPFSDEPFEFAVHDRAVVEEAKQASYEYPRPVDAWSGKGVSAKMSLTDEGCGIASSSGQLDLRPLWRKEKDGKVMELFEGFLKVNIRYGYMYSKKGHGSGLKLDASLWAVRATGKDDHEEDEVGSEDGY